MTAVSILAPVERGSVARLRWFWRVLRRPRPRWWPHRSATSGCAAWSTRRARRGTRRPTRPAPARATPPRPPAFATYDAPADAGRVGRRHGRAAAADRRDARAHPPPGRGWCPRQTTTPATTKTRPPLAGIRVQDRRSRRSDTLSDSLERHGPGGPSGLQNRQAVVAQRLVGSTPAPLRSLKPAWLRAVLQVDRPVGWQFSHCVHLEDTVARVERTGSVKTAPKPRAAGVVALQLARRRRASAELELVRR